MKSYRFLGGHFFGKFWLKFEKDYQNRHFRLLKKQKNGKMTIFKVNNWAKLKSITGPSWGSEKKQLGPIFDFENLHALFFVYFKNVLKPLFYSFFLQKT